MAALASVEYRCSDLRWCYLQQTVHFFQSDTQPVIPNKLAFTSLHCSISNYTFDRRDLDLINLRTNMIQINIRPKHTYIFCNLRPQIRSDQICDARKQNIPGLIDVLIAI